ncbi:MAG TPA: Ig-like domain-containing protein [Gemmatimonadaceae bacterium]
MTGRPLVRRAVAPRIAGILVLALVGITCRDRDPMGPGLPSQASLAIAPQMARAAAAGGPSFVSLQKVRGILTPVGGGQPYSVEATFVNDTATLAFDVTFAGPTQRYSLSLTAIDTAGDTLFRSLREVTATPGSNAPVHDTLKYVAPDTAVATIALAVGDTMVLGGDTLVVSATGLDAQRKPVTPLYVGWTSHDSLVAKVVSSGPATGRIIGRDVDGVTWIVARAFNGTADSLPMRVVANVGSVVLAADTLRTTVGLAVEGSATVFGASGAPIDRPVTWSSLDTTIALVQPLVAAVSTIPLEGAAAGAQLISVLGVRAGATRIVARSGAKADTSVVIVAPAPVASLRIVPDSLALLVGDSARFGVVLLDARGDTLSGRTVAWSSLDPQLAGVDATTGTVRGLAVGTVAVTATSEGVTDTAWVRVAAQAAAIARTVVTPKTLQFLALGESAQLHAQSYAPDSSLAPGRYSWSIGAGAGIVSVDSLGLVKALAVGNAWVIATEQGGTTDSAQVTVEQLVQTVRISPSIVTGGVGDTVRFAATAIDAAGNAIDYGVVTWKNRQNFVTTLDASGLVTLAEPGLDTVSVTIGGLTARARVTVLGAASAVAISGPTAFTALRDTSVLHASALDQNQKPLANAVFEWSTQNPSVAAIVATGGDSAVVVSLANGDGAVTARMGTASASSRISVAQKPASLVLYPASASLAPGGRAMFAPQLLDARGVAMAQGAEVATWSLASGADSALAQVDGQGEVLATGGGGTAKVQASVAGLTSTALVSVSDTGAKVVRFGRDTILVGLDTVKVPVILSAPAGGQGLVVTLGVIGSQAEWVGGNTVTFGPTETLQYAQLTGREAGAATLTVEDSGRVFAADSALGVVRSGAQLADNWFYPILDTVHVNATDDVPLRVLMRNAAPAGGASIGMLVEGPQGTATLSPAPARIPAGQLSTDVVLHAATPGVVRYTPQTSGFPGAASVFVIDTAMLTLYGDTSTSGCDGPCGARPRATRASAKHVFPSMPYDAPRRAQASAAVLDQQRVAQQRVRAASASGPRLASAQLRNRGTTDHIVLGAGQYLPTASYSGSCYARCGAVLELPNHTFAGVRATITADDPTIVRAQDAVEIPTEYAASYMAVSALAAGTTTLRARAADWREAALPVTVTTPRLIAVWNGARLTLPGHIEGDSIDVLVADSLYIAHPRLSSLAVRASSSAPQVVDVRDSIVVVPAGDARTAVFLVPRAAGSAWIRVRAGGHVADSVQVTVGSPRLQTSVQTITIGAGQMRQDAPIELADPATSTVVFSVRSLDPSIASVRDTQFVIVPGWSYPRSGPSSPTIVGVKTGTTRIVVTADNGFAPESLDVVVTTPHINAYMPDATAGVVTSLYVFATDSTGAWTASADPNGLDGVRVWSSDKSVLALDTTVTIPPGAQYTTLNVMPLAAGSTIVRAERTGYVSDSGFTATVSGPLLSAGLNSCTYTGYYYCPSDRVGVGQQSGGADLRVMVNAPATRDVVVRFSGAKHVQLPDSVVIPTGQSEATFGFSGLSAGVDSVVVSAGAGYNESWMIVGALPSFTQAVVNGSSGYFPDTVSVGGTMPLYLQVLDQSYQTHPAAKDISFQITSSDPKVVTTDSAALLLPIGGTQTATSYLTFGAQGTATLTITDPSGTLAPVTLGPVVVTGQRLRFTDTRATVGTRQTTDVTVQLPMAVDGLIVELRSSDERLAKVQVPEDTVRGASSATFRVETFDTTGTVQLEARANGYDRATIPLIITRGRLYAYLPSDASLQTAPVTPVVDVGDEFGYYHPTTVPLAIDVTPAHPEVVGPAVKVQVAVGATEGSADAQVSFLRVGTTDVTVREESGRASGYLPVTQSVTVRGARLSSTDQRVWLAPGQVATLQPQLEGSSTASLKVHFDVRPGSAISLPADQQLAAGSYGFSYDVIAKAPGIDTLAILVDAYEAARQIVRVGDGRISFDEGGTLPDSLAVGDSAQIALTALPPNGAWDNYMQADTASFSVEYRGAAATLSDGTTTLATITVPAGARTSGSFWLKATGVAGDVGDIVVSRPGYGSYRILVRIVTPPAGVIARAVTP